MQWNMMVIREGEVRSAHWQDFSWHNVVRTGVIELV